MSGSIPQTSSGAPAPGVVKVLPYCSVPEPAGIFPIGVVARLGDKSGKPLPGLAAVAKQPGRHVGLDLKVPVCGASHYG